MNTINSLPRILIIDDLFGRRHADPRNEERANLCGQFLIEDVSGDEIGKATPQRIKKPVAQAVFCRGQQPVCSTVGDTVENDLEGTLSVIREGWQPDKPRWAMVLLDLCFYTGQVTEKSEKEKGLGMPEGRNGDDDPKRYFGLQLLRAIQTNFPDLPVVILSSKPRKQVSREFSAGGAFNFLERGDDLSPERLRECIQYDGLIPDETGKIIGHSKALLLCLRTARRAGLTQRNILIRGEQGTGKELLAAFLHEQRDKNSPFVVVNSANFTSELFASELFGIGDKVASQVKKRDGLIKQADGGDLFFDEIKDMPDQVQAGVLRVLQDGEIRAVGAETSQTVNVRFISATNADIEALSGAGKYRSDLLNRLHEGGTIYLPPLRERKEEIPALTEFFLRKAESENPRAKQGRKIDPDVLAKLCAYDWPGNIRELGNCIHSAVNNYPNVDYLAPIHIQFSSEPKQLKSTVYVPETSQETVYSQTTSDFSNFMDSFVFSSHAADLEGKLDYFALFLAKYITAALKATSKNKTAKNRDGELNLEGAMKLITGNHNLKGKAPSQLLKRLLKMNPDVIKKLKEPLLNEAAKRVDLQ